MTPVQIELIANELITKEYDNGEFICKGIKNFYKEKEFPKYIYVIKSGESMMYINNVFVRTLSVGHHFGEIEILQNVPFPFDKIAKGKVSLYAIFVDKLEFILGKNFRSELIKSYVCYLMKRSSVLKNIQTKKILSINNQFELIYYKYNNIVVPKNTLFLEDIIFLIGGNISNVS